MTMPYSKAHKAHTRAKIVAAAAHAFRQDGLSGAGIPQVMRQAGLTHGGFYAHFESKDELVAEACTSGFTESTERLLRKAARTAPDKALGTIITAYLSPSHRDSPDSGCMIPALAGDIARAPADVRAAFTRGLESYAQQVSAYLPPSADGDAKQRVDEALVLLAGMAGALSLARAVDDPQVSERILGTARAFYTQAFGGRGAEEGNG
jgi:TetR/AcrR family transcriptional regulator, transcriptional repressor for nem operon